jgi:hypothetical protein
MNVLFPIIAILLALGFLSAVMLYSACRVSDQKGDR